MKIRAAVAREKGGRFNIEEIELDEPREDEVIVRVAGSGICHTDFMPWNGSVPARFPAVYGHEGSGTVEKVGTKVTEVKPGDRVVMTFNYCGVCTPCRNGQVSHCVDHFKANFAQQRFSDGSPSMRKGDETIHGGFFNQSSWASHALALEKTVVKIQDDVPLELFGPMGCGIQTGAGAVINSLNPNAGDSIAIFGTGSVGMSSVMAAVVNGCGKIIVVDINEARLELAKELGATHVINPTKCNPVDEIIKLTQGGADYSLNCTGNLVAARQTVDCIRIKGVAGLVGATAFGAEISFDYWSLLLGRTVKGICQGDSIPKLFIPKLVDLYKQGRFPLDKLVKYYALDEINDAVSDTLKGTTIKCIIKP